MTPYVNFYYFFILGAVLAPAIIARLRGGKIPKYEAFATVLLLTLTFSKDWNQLPWFIAFVIAETIIIKVYFTYRQKKNETSVFYLAVVGSLLPLIITKITPLFDTVVGFLGISYLTFKAVGMILEIRDGLIKEMKVYEFLRFLVFFPTFTSGPIDRFRRFQQDDKKVQTKDEYKQLLANGIHHLFIGFLYKFILAYTINDYVLNTRFIAEGTWDSKVVYLYAYSLYLFFDFAGYSRFAIGTSNLLGIHTPKNFDMPFISRNIKDFWNRWHMSLSFWFRDYVYMRFVFTATKKKWFKDRFVTSYMGYLLLFLLMGVWHGLQWHFIAYGLYHALLIIGFDWLDRKNKKLKFWPNNKWTHAIGVIITFHAICFGFYIFSGKLFS